jgi:hypothetical protein
VHHGKMRNGLTKEKNIGEYSMEPDREEKNG